MPELYVNDNIDKKVELTDNHEMRNEEREMQQEEEEETCCCICLGEFDDNLIIEPGEMKLDGRGNEEFKCDICSFISHRHCIQKYYCMERKTKCPQCKNELNDKMIIGDYSLKLVNNSFMTDKMNFLNINMGHEKVHISDCVTYLFLNDSNKLNRSDGDYPAMIYISYLKELTCLEYINNGISHRDRKLGPATIHYLTNYNIHTFIENGAILGLEDHASVITYNFTKNIISYTYCNNNGVIHRSNDLPARIKVNMDDETIIISKEYFINGKYSRLNDLPAKILFYVNGNIECISWLIDDKFKRLNDNDPIQIKYYESGKIKQKLFTHKKRQWFDEKTGNELDLEDEDDEEEYCDDCDCTSCRRNRNIERMFLERALQGFLLLNID